MQIGGQKNGAQAIGNFGSESIQCLQGFSGLWVKDNYGIPLDRQTIEAGRQGLSTLPIGFQSNVVPLHATSLCLTQARHHSGFQTESLAYIQLYH